MHLLSFVATEERAQSMTDDKDLWCKVKPRLWFYDDLQREQAIPYFSPQLEFEQTTLLDKDPAKVKDEASWKTNEWALDKKGRVDDKRRSVDVDYNPQFQNNRTQGPAQQRFKNQLVKSGRKYHSAKELCESPSSMGPDFCSTEEGLFCDMEHKKTWPLCCEEIPTNCFDEEKNEMRRGRNHPRDLVVKRYEKVSQW